jgi:hypothetical protein
MQQIDVEVQLACAHYNVLARDDFSESNSSRRRSAIDLLYEATTSVIAFASQTVIAPHRRDEASSSSEVHFDKFDVLPVSFVVENSNR